MHQMDPRFPKEPKNTWMTWTGYKEATFDDIKRSQNADGSWTGGYVGPVPRRF